MQDYEVTYILAPTLADEEVAGANERVSSLISNAGGEVVDVHPWGGKRRLAYPIEHHRDGYYITTKFKTAPEAAYAFDAQLKLQDAVIRHMVFRMDEQKAAPVRRRGEE